MHKIRPIYLPVLPLKFIGLQSRTTAKQLHTDLLSLRKFMLIHMYAFGVDLIMYAGSRHGFERADNICMYVWRGVCFCDSSRG